MFVDTYVSCYISMRFVLPHTIRSHTSPFSNQSSYYARSREYSFFFLFILRLAALENITRGKFCFFVALMLDLASNSHKEWCRDDLEAEKVPRQNTPIEINLTLISLYLDSERRPSVMSFGKVDKNIHKENIHRENIFSKNM